MTNQFNRRNFIKQTAATAAIIGTGLGSLKAENSYFGTKTSDDSVDKKGAQRLSLKRLKRFQELGYGMFIHFGMSTFSNDEFDDGSNPSTLYNPSRLDVDQWVQVIRDAGMKYAILTTKHVAGHCLWPSKYTDYHVGTSGNKTDVVEAFVKACDKYGILPGFYYCSWDNHHRFGSATPSSVGWNEAYTTMEYREFQMKQVEELLTQYGTIPEMWIDIPQKLEYAGRKKQYEQIASLQPDTVIMLNHGISNGTKLNTANAWPTDLMAIERYLPTSDRGYDPWFSIKDFMGEEKDYYIPGEVCDPVGYEWFWKEEDQLRSVNELLGMRLICKERGVNLLLDVPPDRSGQIPKATVERLMELEKKYAQAI